MQFVGTRIDNRASVRDLKARYKIFSMSSRLGPIATRSPSATFGMLPFTDSPTAYIIACVLIAS